MSKKLSEQYYEESRKRGLTDNITSSPEPDYQLPFYQEIFQLMIGYAESQLQDPLSEWICEDHPWEEMGHGGCLGAGAPKTAQGLLTMLQIKKAKQLTKEYKSWSSGVIYNLYNRVIELEFELLASGTK